MRPEPGIVDYVSELDAYRAARAEANLEEASEPEESEEFQAWKALDSTRRHAERLRERQGQLSRALVRQAFGSDDPMVRGLAMQLAEVYQQLKDVT